MLEFTKGTLRGKLVVCRPIMSLLEKKNMLKLAVSILGKVMYVILHNSLINIFVRINSGW